MIKFQNNKSKKSSTSSENSDNQNPNNTKQQRRNSKKQRNSSVTSLFITSSNNNSNKSGKKMPAKAPIYLKNGYKDGKKLREILSTEMISPPLGDVRHTAHVGRGADDMFGDTKFLMEKELLQQQQAEAAQQQQGGGVGECSGATNMGSTASSEPSLTDDIIQQNPVTGGIATLRRNGNHFWRSSSHKNKSRHLSSNTDENVTRNSSGDHDDVITQQHQIMTSQQQRGHHGDNLSIYEGWGVDMGPSILDDVMRVMDNVEQL